MVKEFYFAFQNSYYNYTLIEYIQFQAQEHYNMGKGLAEVTQ